MSTQSQEIGIAAGISMFHGHFPSKEHNDHEKIPSTANEPMKSESPKHPSKSSLYLKPVGSGRFVLSPSRIPKSFFEF